MIPPRDPKTFTRHFELDYHRRRGVFRRWKLWLSVAAFVICAMTVGAAMINPRWHGVFQAGPVSHAHARFGLECKECHVRPFATLGRLWPGHHDASSVTDAACLKCHDAGRHDPHQLRHTGLEGQAAGCVDCHREHHATELKRLPDQACTQCHADLLTADRADNYAKRIRHFDTGHPDFGAWRRSKPKDPAGDAFRFNHQLHINLAEDWAKVDPNSRPAEAKEYTRIREQGCAACHQPDAGGRIMQAISYHKHCATCHALRVQPLPAEAWSLDAKQRFGADPLPHPATGQGLETVRAALIERYLRIGEPDRVKGGAASQPAILRPANEPAALSDTERRAVGRAQLNESLLWGTEKQECLRCHVKLTDQDGVIRIADPRLQGGRWKAEISRWPAAERFSAAAYADEANRWFPLAYFDHRSHRDQRCESCHAAARASTESRDVLMPTITNCVTCHHQGADATRSDCLTCHRYHDRSKERSRVMTPGGSSAP